MMPSIITILLSCVLLFDGCGSARFDSSHSVTADNRENQRHQPIKSDRTSDFLHSGIFDKNPRGLAAWQAFTHDETYRVATAEDFGFSEAAKLELLQMFGKDSWYERINHPAITGDISRENWFYDLAVIVINTTRSDATRFGLVIFNVPREDKVAASAHWLFRERDLSSALISWHSNWPVLVFYKADGSADPYYINWDKKTQRYLLNKQQKGFGARKSSRLLDRSNR